MPKGKKPKSATAQLDTESRKALKLQEFTRLKQKCIEEEKLSRLNTLKIDNQWRQLLRNIKAKELKKQVEILQATHARQIDRKNAAKLNCQQDLDEAEKQFTLAFQSHLLNIEALIELQQSRLDFLDNEFKEELQSIQNEFGNENDQIKMQHGMDKNNVLGIIQRLEQEFVESEADIQHEYQSFREDIRNKNLEEKHALRIQLEGTIEDLWRQFQQSLSNYNSATEERKAQFESLKSRDQTSAKVIEQQSKRLAKLQDSIAFLKQKLSSSTRECEERNRLLREQKEALQNHFQELKRKMNVLRNDQRRRLTEMIVISNRTLKELEDKVQKAEKIIKLSEMNQKLETAEERIMSFGEGSPAKEETPTEVHALHCFQQKFNKVHMDTMSLEKQRQELRVENENLKALLRQYLDGLSVNDQVISQPNPLFVVNGKTNAPIRPTQKKVTCIDACMSVQNGQVV